MLSIELRSAERFYAGLFLPLEHWCSTFTEGIADQTKTRGMESSVLSGRPGDTMVGYAETGK